MINNFSIKKNKLYIGSFSAEDLVKKYGSPIYVYDAEIIRKRITELKNSITYPHIKIHYACKANTNPEIMKLLKKEGCFIETVSPGEVTIALKAGFKPDEIIFTCSNLSKDELAWLIGNKITVNLDSFTQIKRWGEIKPNSKISLRINQGIGDGHHQHTITGGPGSKFGIDSVLIHEVKKIARKFNLKINGIHQHIGSGSLDEKIILKAIKKLLATANNFNELEYIDFGGGFGIPYKPNEKSINMKVLGEQISKELSLFTKSYKKQPIIRFEPGRYLVAESGVLLTSVVEIKNSPIKKFIGINSGMNQLMRPAIYDSYHEIVNAGNVNGKKEIVSIVGNICESADFFVRDRMITKFVEDDVLAILDTGAYGYAMSSFYNSRPMPAEVLVDGKNSRLIRKSINSF